MPKNFPYFKFVVTDWLTGDICFETFEIQGLFINVCALYWKKDGKLTLEDIRKRYKSDDVINKLMDFVTLKNGFICIDFLDEQLVDIGQISSQNSEKGKKSAELRRLKKEEKLTGVEPNSTAVKNGSTEFNKEKKRKEKKRKEDIVDFDLIFPYNSENFLNTWNILIKEPKWVKKSNNALQGCLQQLSLCNEVDAIQMMKNSINGGWQGLFEIKQEQKNGHTTSKQPGKGPYNPQALNAMHESLKNNT